jgi:hypothetical protein
MMSMLPYDPGALPTHPAPATGEILTLAMEGLPPIKDRRQSIRNREHPLHPCFVALRSVATKAMAGRAWVFSPVELHLVIRSPDPLDHHVLNDYLGGVMDSLDGSSGFTFTFLPIVYEDDCQVYSSSTTWEFAEKNNYTLHVVFR